MFDRGAGCDSKHTRNEIATSQIRRDRIKLLGRIDDAREILWASDIFAMPSLKEGLGVAALEAMASGLPVIASEVGGLREVVEDDRHRDHRAAGGSSGDWIGDCAAGGIGRG